MYIRSSSVIAASERAKRPPDERLRGQDPGGRFDRWTNADRLTALRAWRRLDTAHFPASFIAAVMKMLIASCNLQLASFNF